MESLSGLIARLITELSEIHDDPTPDRTRSVVHEARHALESAQAELADRQKSIDQLHEAYQDLARELSAPRPAVPHDPLLADLKRLSRTVDEPGFVDLQAVQTTMLAAFDRIIADAEYRIQTDEERVRLKGRVATLEASPAMCPRVSEKLGKLGEMYGSPLHTGSLDCALEAAKAVKTFGDPMTLAGERDAARRECDEYKPLLAQIEKLAEAMGVNLALDMSRVELLDHAVQELQDGRRRREMLEARCDELSAQLARQTKHAGQALTDLATKLGFDDPGEALVDDIVGLIGEPLDRVTQYLVHGDITPVQVLYTDAHTTLVRVLSNQDDMLIDSGSAQFVTEHDYDIQQLVKQHTDLKASQAEGARKAIKALVEAGLLKHVE